MECIVSKGSIHYERIGSGHPIIILHGMGTDHRSMKGWLEPVFCSIHGFQRIYIDLPAHGRSLISESLCDSDDILGNVFDFIDQIIPEQAFSLIGASYGGYIAQGIMHHLREWVKSICLLAPAIHLKERSLPDKVILKQDEALLDDIDADIRAAFDTLMTIQTKENLEAFLHEIQPGRALANRDFLASNWREKGYFFSEQPFHDVTTLSQPALIILGKQDAICGYKDHLVFLDSFEKTTFAILDDAGHLLQIEKRDVVQALIQDWLTRTRAIL